MPTLPPKHTLKCLRRDLGSEQYNRPEMSTLLDQQRKALQGNLLAASTEVSKLTVHPRDHRS
jgi:hypothetical protein